MAIEHFSSATVGRSLLARTAMSAEQRALVNELEEVEEAGALALGEFFIRVVTPALARAQNSELSFGSAAVFLNLWAVEVELGFLDQPVSIRSEVTLGQARDDGRASLADAGRTLLANRTKPSCERGGDIVSPRGWVEMPHRLTADLDLLGFSYPEPEMCATARITLEVNNIDLGPDDQTVTVDRVVHDIVGPDGAEEIIVDSQVTLAVTGAEAPPLLIAPSGEATNIVMNRTGAPFARGVRISATATSPLTSLTFMVDAPPAVVQVQEPITAQISASPASFGTEPGTSQVCVTATSGGAPVTDFTATLRMLDPIGSLGPTSVAAAGGSACVTYTSPNPLPPFLSEVRIAADIDATGAVALAQRSISFLGETELILTSCVTLTTGAPGVITWTAAAEIDGATGTKSRSLRVRPTVFGSYDGNCRIIRARAHVRVANGFRIQSQTGRLNATLDLFPSGLILNQSVSGTARHRNSCPEGNAVYDHTFVEVIGNLVDGHMELLTTTDVVGPASDPCALPSPPDQESLVLARLNGNSDDPPLFGGERVRSISSGPNRLDEVKVCRFQRR